LSPPPVKKEGRTDMNSQPKDLLTWSTGAASERGLREENQDRMTRFACPFGEVVAVADGMGGMRGGATAAETVVRMLPELLAQAPASTPVADALRSAVQSINEEVYRLGHGGDPAVANMGTTLVMALLAGNGDVLVANIGDSRAYLFRAGVLRQLTKDHSAVQRLVDAGAISSEEARHHPESSVLTRAIGQQPRVELEIYPPFRLQPGDGLLLCSDGLSGFADSGAIAETLRRPAESAAIVDALGALALAAGSDDNITIQYLRVNGPDGVPQAAAVRKMPWRKYAPFAAAAMVLCAIGIPFLTDDPQAAVQEMRIGNATGENPPKPVAPDRPAPKQKQQEAKQEAKPTPAEKATVIIYVSGQRPEWLAKEVKLDCVVLRQREREELRGRLKDADPSQTHIFYRREAAGAKDCLVKGIPALTGVPATEVAKLPNGADIVVLLPEPQTADI